MTSQLGQENEDKKENNKSGGDLSVTDLVVWQDNLEKLFDANKPDNELTPDEHAVKILYKTLDDLLSESLGEKAKQETDKLRKTMRSFREFEINVKKLNGLGKEINKNLLFQNSYLTLHFDKKNPENTYHININGMSEIMVDSNRPIPPNERVEIAKKILKTIEAYREKIVSDLYAHHEIATSLLPAFEKFLNQTDFKFFGETSRDMEYAIQQKTQFEEWLNLSKEISKSRLKAIQALEEDLDIDELIPKALIRNDGDITKNISPIELKMKGERLKKLLGEADKAEKEIEEKRSKLSESLYGKIEEYVWGIQKTEDKPQETRPTKSKSVSPLHDKAWFRFCKVIYIGAYALVLLLPVYALIEEESDNAVWAILIIIAIFTLIKKGFYYVVLGKTSWKK